MSDATKEALETALTAHLQDETDGKMPTDWLLVAACTSLEKIGTGTMSYFVEGNTGQPIHVTLGLSAYVAAHGPFTEVEWTDDDEEETA